MTVIGISVGTTRTAVCVLRDDAILAYQSHQFDEPWSDDKLSVILEQYEKYFRKYQPSAVMLKIPPSRHHRSAIASIIQEVDSLAKKYDCMFDLITKSEIKNALCMDTTDKMPEYAAALYPDLSNMRNAGKRKNRYNKRLFEAVLGAHVYKEWLRVRGFWERRKTE